MNYSENIATPRIPPEIKTYFTSCPMCGELGPDIVLGLVVKYTDKDGKLIAYGHPGGKLGQQLTDDETEYDYEVLDVHERLPALTICGDCRDLMDAQRLQFSEEVKQGGIRWFCTTCKKAGVIVAEDSLGVSKSIRAGAKVYPPDAVTVRFHECKQHASVEDVTTGIQ